jgi:hypothetical protein
MSTFDARYLTNSYYRLQPGIDPLYDGRRQEPCSCRPQTSRAVNTPIEVSGGVWYRVFTPDGRQYDVKTGRGFNGKTYLAVPTDSLVVLR